VVVLVDRVLPGLLVVLLLQSEGTNLKMRKITKTILGCQLINTRMKMRSTNQRRRKNIVRRRRDHLLLLLLPLKGVHHQNDLPLVQVPVPGEGAHAVAMSRMTLRTNFLPTDRDAHPVVP